MPHRKKTSFDSVIAVENVVESLQMPVWKVIQSIITCWSLDQTAHKQQSVHHHLRAFKDFNFSSTSRFSFAWSISWLREFPATQQINDFIFYCKLTRRYSPLHSITFFTPRNLAPHIRLDHEERLKLQTHFHILLTVCFGRENAALIVKHETLIKIYKSDFLLCVLIFDISAINFSPNDRPRELFLCCHEREVRKEIFAQQKSSWGKCKKKEKILKHIPIKFLRGDAK